MRIAITMALALALAACDDCRPASFRCNGEVLEICTSDGRHWQHHTDCAAIWSPESGDQWTCCETSDAGEDECLPATECPAE